ncbi:hypothetical protein RclHR1_18840002 [Rhizophagus clarus]|uniref:Uncharacterized protein n=1 Tax=Rhizophagus clarus TaxID=94130 RepID=A0A2Z6QN91_9GLOM|nr:hypothetical protein RclHR1_18840002 [Rhizophagus clarus]GES73402.1 hypothetical protein GLOIN_2v1709724 [Rhizophagus clarus]
MNKLLYLTLLVYILLITVTISSASPAPTINKRWCKCLTAFANFNSTRSSGPFRGGVTYFQHEDGTTTVFGAFTGGFRQGCHYNFTIVKNNKVIYDLTSGLNVRINRDGSTQPFNHTFNDLSLTCGSHPILDPYTMVQGDGESGGAKF